MLSKYRQHLGKTFGCLVCLLLVGYPPEMTSFSVKVPGVTCFTGGGLKRKGREQCEG